MVAAVGQNCRGWRRFVGYLGSMPAAEHVEVFAGLESVGHGARGIQSHGGHRWRRGAQRPPAALHPVLDAHRHAVSARAQQAAAQQQT